MIKVYECWSIMDENGNSTKDWTCELWGASTKHPDAKYYFEDWYKEHGTGYIEKEYQIFQWLLWIASNRLWPFHAKEVAEYAMENWYNWG